MGNIVAIALSLSTPRLWILIKALMLSIYHKVENKKNERKSRLTVSRLVSQTLPSIHRPQSVLLTTHHHRSHENVTITQESHSELGAALDVLGNAWNQLTTRSIKLPTYSSNRKWIAFSKCRSWTLIIWRNLLHHSADIITSLVLCTIFIAIFVAECTGSVLSGNIITDGVAISAGLYCAQVLQDSHDYSAYWNHGEMALTYADRCYGANTATDGCNYLYNQSISYTENPNDPCPFAGDVCLEGSRSALTLDTGWLDAKYLGINSEERFQFRRSTTCSPLVADERYVKEVIDSNGHASYNYYYGPAWNGILGKYIRETWKALNTSTEWTVPGFSKGSLCTNANRYETNVHPFSPLKEFTSGDNIITLLFISACKVFFKYRRSDPIFPAPKVTLIAQFPEPSPTMLPHLEDPLRYGRLRYAQVYRANDNRDTVLGCVDRVGVCTKGHTQCWDAAALGLRPKHVAPYWGKIAFFNETAPVSERSLVLSLLTVALAASSVCHAVLAPTQLDAQSKIRGFMADGLAAEQWKVEVRRLFQASLAQMQLSTFRIARGGWTYNDGYGFLGVPESYEALARMVKFNAVGWLNVSVWGFCGLLLFAAMTTLGSIRTGDELWLVIWIRWTLSLGRWGVRGMLWAKSYVWPLPYLISGTARLVEGTVRKIGGVWIPRSWLRRRNINEQ
ncbi:hypothetical protein MMC17_006894 [Xylographa soralifera]|nr:hypothetical protein [Xylographa soralifera]